MFEHAIGHLVRRSLEDSMSITQDPHVPSDPTDRPWEHIQIPFAAAVVLSLTIALFIALLVSVRYTLMGVVGTLAQVETPTSEYVALDPHAHDDSLDDDSAPPAYTDSSDAAAQPVSADPEAAMVARAPITASIRGTIHHIVSIGGATARWRGLWCAVGTSFVHSLIYQMLFGLLAIVLPFAFASVVGGVLTTIILARWYMAWTHIVISEPSTLKWWRRVPSFKTWSKIWAPTALNALAAQVALLGPIGMYYALNLNDVEQLQRASPMSILWKLVAVFLVALVLYLALILPSQVALTRCQASMLPEEDESIVPFDRSFGGKVTPAIVGGSGMLSYIDALKSFDRPSMVRLLKLYGKIFAIDLALHLTFAMVITLQLLTLVSNGVKEAFRVGA